MFLTTAELKTVARQEHVQIIASADDLIITECIATAITEVRSRLTATNKLNGYDGRPRYDTEAIFSQEGEARNPLILAYTKVVAMWHLIVRGNAGVNYEVIEARYDRAVEYLKDLANGSATDLSLPILTAEPPAEAKPFRMGSRLKFNHE